MKRTKYLIAAVPLVLAPLVAYANDNNGYDTDTFQIDQSFTEYNDISYKNDVDVSLKNSVSKKIDVDLKVVGGEDVTVTNTTSHQSQSQSSKEKAFVLDASGKLVLKVNSNDNGNGEAALQTNGDSLDIPNIDVNAEASANVDIKASKTESQSASGTETESSTFPALRVNGISSAVIDNKQVLKHNDTGNVENSNNALMDGNALQNANGNIGANVAAGNNNAQDNAAAIAATEKTDSFIDAEITKLQMSVKNKTANVGADNNATLTGNALQGATGNIGANVAAGQNNAQSNMTAISTGPSKVGMASVAIKQEAAYNQTCNAPARRTEYVETSVDMKLSGTSKGESYQASNFYPDNWDFNPAFPTNQQHPNAPDQLGHSDFDNETQGAVQNPFRTGVGGLAFDNDNKVDLAGVVSFKLPVQVVYKNTVNNATLSGNVLQNAVGNIGVNVAAGSGNLQANALSVSYLSATGGGGEFR